MKRFLMITLLGCGGSPQPPTTSQHVVASTGAPLACGDVTCSDSEICIATSAGGAAPAGPPQPAMTYHCSTTPMSPDTYGCTAVLDRRQTCTSYAP